MTEVVYAGEIGPSPERIIDLEVDDQDQPHITFQVPGQTLTYSYRDGAGWHPDAVELNVSDACGGYARMKLDSAGLPHVVCVPASSEGLRYAHRPTAASDWQFTELTQIISPVSCDIGIDSSNGVHLVGFETYTPMYTTNASGAWLAAPVSLPRDMAYSLWGEVAMDLDSQGRPHFFYRGQGGAYGMLVHVVRGSWGWSASEVQAASSYASAYPLDAHLILDADDSPHVVFRYLSGTIDEVRHARLVED